jgi:myo-inositol 2-dehydrogenase/D-chiro-inositol 1-dehydrogenase
MRIAVIGAGSMGSMHAAVLAGLPEVDELLVVDTDAQRAAEAASRTGARVADLAVAIERAEALVVATPPHLHAEAVIPAVERGRSVLCEKPLSEDLGETVRLAGLGGHLEVGFQRRHDPSFVAAREAARGTPIRLVRLSAFDPLMVDRPAASWPPGEAAPLFLHSAIHDFDALRWLTGQEVVAVSTDGSRRDEPRPSDARGLETATVLMRLSGGTLATLDASWLHPGGYDVRVELLTDAGHLTAGLSARTPARHLDWIAPDERERPAAWSGYLERFEPAYRAELVAFLAAARGEREPATTGRDGVEAMRVAVAATRSYVERRIVALDEVGPGRAAEVA